MGVNYSKQEIKTVTEIVNKNIMEVVTKVKNENNMINNINSNPHKTNKELNQLKNELSGKIIDLTGKNLMNVNTKYIDVSSLSAGIYLLDIVSDDKHYVSKIVKE